MGISCQSEFLGMLSFDSAYSYYQLLAKQQSQTEKLE
jgi:hypothetical protein